MATFMERLRAPLLALSSGIGGAGGYSPGDALDQRASQFLHLTGANRGGGGGLAQGRRGGINPKVNPYGRAVDPTKGPMNVVYDQGPEQFNKKLALEKENLTLKRETNDMINAIRQQDADTRKQRADAYEYGVENPLGQIVVPRGGNAVVIDKRTGRAIDTGVAGGSMTQEDELTKRAAASLAGIIERGEQGRETAGVNNAARAGLAAEAEKGRNARLAAQQKGATDRQEDAQNFTAGRPREHSAALNNRVREMASSDPNIAKAITWDPQGNFVLDPNLEEGERARITAQIYGPTKKDINLGKGSDSRALDPRAVAGNPTVTMTFPDGTTRAVAADRVAAAEAVGARRR